MLCGTPVWRDQAGGLSGCGQCHQCRLNRRRQKTARIILENQEHMDALFVTLTYSDEFLPTEIYHPKTGEVEYSHPLGVLDKAEYQRFHKRVFRARPPKTVRFWGVGEYGEQGFRPHYHFIFWGIPFKDREVFFDAWTDPKTGLLKCDRERLDVQIPRDESHVGQYVSGYVVKSMTNPETLYNKRRLDGRSPEFSTSSKGIGLAFADKFSAAMKSRSGQAYIGVHQDIPRSISISGKSYPLDRYLRGKILDKLEIKDMADASAQARFAKEMQNLQDVAAQNPQVPQIWLTSRPGWAAEKQAELDRAQALLNVETKLALHNRPRGKGDF